MNSDTTCYLVFPLWFFASQAGRGSRTRVFLTVTGGAIFLMLGFRGEVGLVLWLFGAAAKVVLRQPALAASLRKALTISVTLPLYGAALLLDRFHLIRVEAVSWLTVGFRAVCVQPRERDSVTCDGPSVPGHRHGPGRNVLHALRSPSAHPGLFAGLAHPFDEVAAGCAPSPPVAIGHRRRVCLCLRRLPADGGEDRRCASPDSSEVAGGTPTDLCADVINGWLDPRSITVNLVKLVSIPARHVSNAARRDSVNLSEWFTLTPYHTTARTQWLEMMPGLTGRGAAGKIANEVARRCTF